MKAVFMHFSHNGFDSIQINFCTVIFVTMSFNSAVGNNEEVVMDGSGPESQNEGVGAPEGIEGRAEGPEGNAGMPVCPAPSISLFASPTPPLHMNSANSAGIPTRFAYLPKNPHTDMIGRGHKKRAKGE